MRIIIASDLHWPHVNGIATFGRNLARGLVEAGHEVMVVAPSETGKRYRERDVNYAVTRTASMLLPFHPGMRVSLSPAGEIKKAVREFKPDVIHVQTALGVGLGAIAAAKKFRVPLVGTVHVMADNLVENLKLLAPFARQIDYILREYGSRFYGAADFVTMPTRAAIRMLKPDSFATPLRPISNGIDLRRFYPEPVPKEFRARYGIPEDRPVVLYVGRLDAEKHVPILLRAIAVLLERRDAQVVIVGSGSDDESLKALAAELGIQDRVMFTGRVEEAEKLSFLRCADVFAMPSPTELQSIATLEAMACARPVVAVSVGALTELCHDGYNGYGFSQDDVQGMADGLLRVLADPEQAGVFGHRSLEIARRHDLAQTVKQFEELYAQVIAKRQAVAKVVARAH